jgi:hypothetical protein
MKREGKVNVKISQQRYELLPDNLQHFYNCCVETNKTVKQSYYCPFGKSKCRMCSRPKNAGSYKRKQRKQDFHSVMKHNILM